MHHLFFSLFTLYLNDLPLLVVQGLAAEVQRAKTGTGDSGTDGDHNGNLIENGGHGQGARQNLAGHHPGQGDNAHTHHGVEGGQHGGLQGLTDKGQQNVLRRGPHAHQRLNLAALVVDGLSEGLHPQGCPGRKYSLGRREWTH